MELVNFMELWKKKTELPNNFELLEKEKIPTPLPTHIHKLSMTPVTDYFHRPAWAGCLAMLPALVHPLIC